MHFLTIFVRTLPLFLLPLAACTSASPHHRASGDPCHLPYLDGGKYFVASLYAYEGKATPSQKKWSKSGHHHGAVRVEPPADGFPKDLDVVLVLNSTRPVEWQISPALAAKTGAVLLAGDDRPLITGLPASVPVIEASHEQGLNGEAICRPLATLYGDNKDQSLHERTAETVDALTAMGLDRISEMKSPSVMAIPGYHKPYMFMKGS